MKSDISSVGGKSSYKVELARHFFYSNFPLPSQQRSNKSAEIVFGGNDFVERHHSRRGRPARAVSEDDRSLSVA